MNRPFPPEIPLRADERIMLNAFLDFYRAELIDRALDLDHGQLQITLPPSTLTLSRLLGHMMMVEDIWFAQRLDGDEPAESFATLDWEADVDAEMTLAQAWPVVELLARFEAAVADSRAREAAAASVDQLSVRADRHGEHWSLRWILIHMIEEYARHCGHADLIRESIDGNLAD